MALRYWLPCNGSIKNLGMAGDVCIDEVPTYKEGLSGKALATRTYIPADQSNDIILGIKFSVAMWVYVDADEGTVAGPNIFFGNNAKRIHCLFNYPTVNDLHWSYHNADCTTFPCSGVITGALPSYTWTHVILTYDGRVVRVYVNGELKGTGNYTVQWTDYSINIPITITRTDFRYSDIRIYDHCLSAKEIDIISRPLVFRQLLSRGADPLIYNTDEYASYGLSDLSGFGHGIVIDGIVVWQSNSPLSYGSVAFDGRGYFSTPNIELNTPGCNYTFWAKVASWSGMTQGQSYPVLSFENDLTEIKFLNGSIEVVIETEDSYCDHSYDVSTLTDGWHFFSVSYDKGSVEVRVDDNEAYGTQFDETSNVETGTGDMIIGKDLEGNLANGLSLYDMRVYAMRLSMDDLNDLYIAKIGVDNKGNLYAHNIEPNTDQIAFGANGVVKADIIESENGFRAYKDHIECTNFQEI